METFWLFAANVCSQEEEEDVHFQEHGITLYVGSWSLASDNERHGFISVLFYIVQQPMAAAVASMKTIENIYGNNIERR